VRGLDSQLPIQTRDLRPRRLTGARQGNRDSGSHRSGERPFGVEVTQVQPGAVTALLRLGAQIWSWPWSKAR
jgi:hypothetical protein